MTDRDALLAAIFANPDDDLPRLVFADWLVEHGEPEFAEFIRVEIERDRLDRDDPRRKELNDRSYELRRRGAFPGDVRGTSILAPTRRGFHYSLQASPLELAAHLDRIGPYAPTLDVMLGGDTEDVRSANREFAEGGKDRVGEAFVEIFTSRWVRQWLSVEFHSLPLTAPHILSMTLFCPLHNLQQLVFAGGLSDEAAARLNGATFPNLTVLAVHELRDRDGSVLTSSGLSALICNATLLAPIESLSLMGEWIGDRGLQVLASSPTISGVKGLRLWTRGHSPEVLRHFLTSCEFDSLSILDLSWMPIDQETASLLARSTTLPKLTQLAVTLAKGVDRSELVTRFGDGLVVDEE